MTNYEKLQQTVEAAAWTLCRSMWTCFECPKLDVCIKMTKKKGLKTPDDLICMEALNEWLDEVYVDPFESTEVSKG